MLLCLAECQCRIAEFRKRTDSCRAEAAAAALIVPEKTYVHSQTVKEVQEEAEERSQDQSNDRDAMVLTIKRGTF